MTARDVTEDGTLQRSEGLEPCLIDNHVASGHFIWRPKALLKLITPPEPHTHPGRRCSAKCFVETFKTRLKKETTSLFPQMAPTSTCLTLKRLSCLLLIFETLRQVSVGPRPLTTTTPSRFLFQLPRSHFTLSCDEGGPVPD